MCNFFNVKYRKHSREISILKKKKGGLKLGEEFIINGGVTFWKRFFP